MDKWLEQYAQTPERIRYSAIAALVLFIIGSYYFFVHIGQVTILEEASAELQKKDAERVEKQTYANDIGRYQARLIELQRDLETARALLPDSADIPQFLAQVGNRGTDAGLIIDKFEPKSETEQDFYAEILFATQVHGSYHEIGAFIDLVGRLDRIVNVVGLTMNNPRSENQRIVVDGSFTIKTFRFLPEGERKKDDKKGGAK